MSDRVMVFIDYQNVHFSALSQFHPRGTSPSVGHVNPRRIGELLVARRRRDSELIGVHVYRGSPVATHQPGAAGANDRQASVWSHDELVTVYRRPLSYRGWPATPPQEKGIDVELAVDFVRMALTGLYDVGIMFSRDTDLLPALETVHDLTPARVEVATWGRSAGRLQFPGTTRPWCHYVNREAYELVRDHTNYARPAPSMFGAWVDVGN